MYRHHKNNRKITFIQLSFQQEMGSNQNQIHFLVLAFTYGQVLVFYSFHAMELMVAVEQAYVNSDVSKTISQIAAGYAIRKNQIQKMAPGDN